MKRFALFCLLAGLSLAGWSAPASYTFAVSPQQSASDLAEIWAPVLAWLSERSGVNLRFATAKDSADFASRLGRGTYDFCYVNPHQYTLLHEKPGYQAMAREKDRRLKGILVTRKNSGIKSLKDLEGATLVFSSPTSFAASILTQAELRKQGIGFTPRYVNSHESVFLNVEKGLFPAGGGTTRTLEMADAPVRDNLSVLWTTQGYTPHAIASHARVPASVVKKVQAAMLAMNDDPAARPLLEKIGFKGFQAAVDADWNDIRALDLKPEN